MKPKIEVVIKLILMLVILYTSSLVSFAGTKKSKSKKATISQQSTDTVPVVDHAPQLSDAPLQPAGSADSIQNPLTPKLKKRHRVAIVPAPPPGNIPVYTPPKQ